MSTQGPRRTDAKAFFANERTFMHWMNMAVTIGSISAALLGVSGHAHKNWGPEYLRKAIAVRVLSLVMMVIGIAMAIYAAVNFRIRGNMLLAKMDGPYDNRLLPVVLSVVIITFMAIVFFGTLIDYEGWAQ